MLFVVVLGTISWTSTVSDPFYTWIKGVPYVIHIIPDTNKAAWITIIAGILFLAILIWTLWDQSRKLEISEDKRPDISVKEQLPGEMWNLEITNKGERGIFSAEIILFDKENATGEWYPALWSQQNSDKADLMNGQRDIIKLASISHIDDRKTYFDIRAYNTLNKYPETVRHIELDEKELSKTYQQRIQVKITSDPRPRNGPILKEYILNTEGMTIIKKPKPRKAGPGRYLLGSDSDIVDKAFSIEWKTDIWEQDKDELILKGLVTIKSTGPIHVDTVKIKIGDKLFESNWQPNLYWTGATHTIFHIPFNIKQGKRQATIEYMVEGNAGVTDVFEIDIPKPHYPPSFGFI